MRHAVFAAITMTLIVASSVAWYRAVAARPDGAVTQQLQAVLLPQPRPLLKFTLSDQRNLPFDNARLADRWTLLFFGYTYCPDICPTTMVALKQAERELEQMSGIRPQIALVSVDPIRDDAETLGRYVTHFSPAYLGLRGSDEQLQALARQIGAMYERDAPDANGNYQVAHSGSIFVVNPAGGLHAVFSAPHKASYIAAKMAAMVDHYGIP